MTRHRDIGRLRIAVGWFGWRPRVFQSTRRVQVVADGWTWQVQAVLACWLCLRLEWRVSISAPGNQYNDTKPTR